MADTTAVDTDVPTITGGTVFVSSHATPPKPRAVIPVTPEGRVPLANRAAFAPGDAREDWAILRALSDVLGHRLPFDSLNALRAKLYAAYPHFAAVERVQPADGFAAIQALANIGGTLGREPFVSPVKDFYLTNPIARASGVMAECSALARELKLEAAE